jgi:hypothetical protein
MSKLAVIALLGMVVVAAAMDAEIQKKVGMVHNRCKQVIYRRCQQALQLAMANTH